MLQPSNGNKTLRPRHTLAIAAGVVVAVLIAFWAFSFVVGVIAFVVKLAIVLGVAWLLVHLVLRSARK